MAQIKQSARQLTDAAAASIPVPTPTAADPDKPKRKGGRPDNFVGDRPGFFRGARVRR